ncbi:hypothetical protein KOW79_011671 [Hemibagrus wyckioides]|uniref:Uncharacterized protein n=1 Tax=Hemibagrus wyckioides TaxID=337641 RepID=A0A9D3SIT0_9TELE|nr:uncharacterized protein LOC131363275 isoform X1 [Hemibagrus wyckioides]KAG7325355.1 hypothetical protein KOW79_011671 [Hemibagrus wyckioides]
MLEEGWGTSEHEQTITSVISEGEKERKKSQEDLDTETSLSMPSVLCPSPQELGVKIMTDQHSMNTSPCPPEASRSALGDTPSPDQKSNICNILIINVLECTSQHTLYIYENIKEITLKYIPSILETSSYENEIYKYTPYIKYIKMCYDTLKKIGIDPNEKRGQYAVAYLCKKDGSELMIGPFSPRDRHSEDFITEKNSDLVKKNEKEEEDGRSWSFVEKRVSGDELLRHFKKLDLKTNTINIEKDEINFTIEPLSINQHKLYFKIDAVFLNNDAIEVSKKKLCNLRSQYDHLERFFDVFSKCEIDKILYHQTAFAVLIMKDNTYKTVGPKKPKNKKHSEERMLTEMSKNVKDISKILFFTTNSPCLAREGTPCRDSLLKFSQDHQIPITVFFKRPYVFSRNIEDLIKEEEKLLWDTDYEFHLKFDIKDFIYKFKETDESERTIIYNSIKYICSKYSNEAQTYQKWKQAETEIWEELESKLREKIKKISNEYFTKIKDMFCKWWTLTITETLNTFVALPILKQIEGLQNHIQFFRIELEENSNVNFTIYG